jgi:phenylpyruvate tautomerase PptA (4-oxalocrotonate tautomerase family)
VGWGHHRRRLGAAAPANDRLRDVCPRNRTKGELTMPVVFIEAPPGLRIDAKKKLVEEITAAVDEAYHISDTLIFLREYPAEAVAMNGQLQSENPKIVEALKKIRS